MPSDIMEQRGVSTPSHFHEDIHITSERQFGFMKTDMMPENQGGRDRLSSMPKSSWTSESYQLKPQSSFSGSHPSGSPNARNTTNGSQWESSLFSSSMSDLFSRKLRLQGSDMLSTMSANTVVTHREEPSESLEEIEAQTIGNLLPDEDDLFAEVTGEVGRKSRANTGDELDEFDLFSSVGGMELDGDIFSSVSHRNGERGGNNSVGELNRGEIPSRTLLVGNISSNVEDYELKVLFEQFGDIQALHTACKNRGFIMVSYCDIRAAQNAARALQNKLLRGTKLDIRYSISKENPSQKDTSKGALLVNNLDSSISNQELNRLVKSYGEVKEIRRTMHDNSQIYIEFFDVRAAAAALGGLNGLEVAGKKLQLVPTYPEGTRYTSQCAANDTEGCLPKTSYSNTSSGHIGRHFPGMISSTSSDGGSMRVIHNSIGSPVNSFIERHRSLSIPIGFPPSANGISASKPVGLQEHGHHFDNSNMGIQSMPNLHPHSFSEYVDNFANGSPYTSSAFSEMVSDGSKANEGFMIHNVRGVEGFSGGGIGSPMHQSSRRPINLWSNSNTQQQNPSSGMMWPNSPSHINSIPTQRPPVTVFSRAPPIMVNMASSPVHHHIGSAPVLNSPFWDRRQAYVAESLESSGFHIGSHGSMGIPGSSPSHPMDIGSHKTFSVGGNRMDVNSQNAVLRSPQQLSHLFPGRSPMGSMPGSFDSPNERYRNLSHRRSESSSSNADKKLYELDVDRILRGEDRRTTLMIKNIPNKYTSKMLLSAIDEHCKGTYDFLYLPIDFKNKCNVGYAFINLIEPEKIVPFFKAFNGKKWEKFNSEKVATLTYARIQGKTALIAHFQNSSLMNEDKRCRPILFHTDGPNAGDQEPFPMGSNIRSRPGKPRSSSIDNYNSFSISSVSENREETPNGTDPFLKEN
ncbi:RNA recognition motif domain [Arabidopsis thaliana x Arabidopsis arenosa]|uniref:ML1 n=2 Tax=Arabidopsis TaxID=3701 RepID=A0A178UI32_ARATH|nr:RNA recognition motif domain [Arabidopsis thaliana x Arabidopsis arenosa]OAO92752.1 ML1 [Arabidopsis thaliana]